MNANVILETGFALSLMAMTLAKLRKRPALIQGIAWTCAVATSLAIGWRIG